MYSCTSCARKLTFARARAHMGYFVSVDGYVCIKGKQGHYAIRRMDDEKKPEESSDSRKGGCRISSTSNGLNSQVSVCYVCPEW